jgi:type IV pilus assembly protein PilY1
LFDIRVNTFVIGFGKDAGTNKATLNNIARAGSGNNYDAFFTDTLAGLTNAIQTIFQIIGGSYARSSPVVSRNRDRLYRGYFNLPGYEGHLAAYDLKPDGTLITPEKWDAGKVMNSNGRGPVSTWVDGSFGKSKGDFTDVTLADKSGKKLETYLNPLGEDIDSGGNIGKKDSETITNFTLGPNYDDCTYLPPLKCHGPGYYKGVRSGKWLLGDIYHSTPLVVGAPNFNFPDIPAFTSKYSDFKTNWKNRETIIYVGANDGMVHAFKDSDGTEKFGIIPNNLLGKLKELRTNSHQFFVDSSPRAYDVFFGASWSTVIISGERGGGNSYFALDVTDPSDANYPIVLWDVTDPAMGNTWSRPEIGWVRISGQEKFVAFVGGGYSTTDDVGNTFYVIDIADGSILRKFIVGASSNKIPGGATAFDSDLDGRVNGVYFGDFNGVLWKIKIDGEEDISKWQLIKLHTPSTNSPVFYPPAVTKNNQGKILVFYGQGNELNIFNVDSNSFFEIWDNADSGVKNWEESLGAGEKVLAAPAMANNVVYFTTWVYTGDKSDCGAGKGRLYGLTTTSAAGPGDIGALVLDPLTGADLGAKKKYFEITDPNYFPDSRGIPSAPVVTNGMIYLSTSLNANQVPLFRIPQWGAQMRLKSWREVF